MSAPVPYTCPDIDHCIDETDKAIKVLEDFIDDARSILAESIIAQLGQVASDLSSLTGGKGKMEKIRQANEKLRDWGEQQEDRANDLEQEVERLQERIAELEHERKQLEAA